ncbi:MAG: TetR/AcrR family transcriptional regulator [Planctomycetota bacterium]
MKKPVSPRKQPSQGRSRFTVRQIVEAAARVFEERGYAGATTNRIAGRAGVSIGSLYQYFPNKESILAVLLEQHTQEVANAVEAIRRHVAEEPHDLIGVLEHFVEDMVELHSKNPRLQHVLLDEAPRPPHLKAKLQELEQAAVESTEILLRANPQVRIEDHRTAAYLAVQSIETLVHRFVVEPPDDVSRKRFAAELVEMLVRYLRKD